MGPFYSGFIQNLGVLHKHTPQGLDSFYHASNVGKRDKYILMISLLLNWCIT